MIIGVVSAPTDGITTAARARLGRSALRLCRPRTRYRSRHAVVSYPTQ